MSAVPFWACLIFFMLFSSANCEKEEVRRALVVFMDKLSSENVQRDVNWGWNLSSDPCLHKWEGVTCDLTTNQTVKKIVLDQRNLAGVIDAGSLCQATSLQVLSLNSNNVGGNFPAEILTCKSLTHLYLRSNNFSTEIPSTLSRLNNLKRLDLSDNKFSGQLPDMSRISGLLTVLVQNNNLTGNIPEFDFSNFENFNVSNNNLTGPIPDGGSRFNSSCFLGNLGLCGNPLPNSCPAPVKKRSKLDTSLIYFGYALIVLVIVLLITIKLIKKIYKPKVEKSGFKANALGVSSKSSSKSGYGSGFVSSESRIRGYISEYSITSAESGGTSSSLVILSNTPVANGMRFEDLLRAPAELISRGIHSSLYKVGPTWAGPLAVKRIRDWKISSDDFATRMQRINQVKHPKVLPVAAYYCSKQEKLLVYKFQKNGSLFNLLHGSRNGQYFSWSSRLSIAAKIAEALAFMHEALHVDGIAHGNLKSTNILLNDEMESCISEYGLMETEFFESSESDNSYVNDPFKVDIYRFAIILLELLTGKIAQNNGVDLAEWVRVVVKEEWTGEVFDNSLTSEGADEERMVNLLQVALKCINHSADSRPTMTQVVQTIFSIKEDEERSTSS